MIVKNFKRRTTYECKELRAGAMSQAQLTSPFPIRAVGPGTMWKHNVLRPIGMRPSGSGAASSLPPINIIKGQTVKGVDECSFRLGLPTL